MSNLYSNAIALILLMVDCQFSLFVSVSIANLIPKIFILVTFCRFGKCVLIIFMILGELDRILDFWMFSESPE